jgi:hypothetical protein
MNPIETKNRKTPILPNIDDFGRAEEMAKPRSPEVPNIRSCLGARLNPKSGSDFLSHQDSSRHHNTSDMVRHREPSSA